jgi:thiol-disulfide isomerase/thioredoxin
MRRLIQLFLKRAAFTLALVCVFNIGSAWLTASDANAVVVDFEAEDLEGQPFEGRSLKGKTLVLDFWAVWCLPCLEAMPALNRLSQDFEEKELQVVGIAVYSGSSQDVRKFLEKREVDYKILVGAEDILEKFEVIGFPTYILIDPEGRVYKKYVGEVEDLYQTFSDDIAELRQKNN